MDDRGAAGEDEGQASSRVQALRCIRQGSVEAPRSWMKFGKVYSVARGGEMENSGEAGSEEEKRTESTSYAADCGQTTAGLWSDRKTGLERMMRDLIGKMF